MDRHGGSAGSVRGRTWEKRRSPQSLLAACLLVVMSGCSDSDSDRGYRKLSEREVGVLDLSRIDSLVLAIPEGRILGVRDFKRSDKGYLVLDGYSAKGHLFDIRGRHLATFGGKGDGPGEFRDPMGVAFYHDSLLVLDPSRRALTTLAPDGGWIATEPLPLPHAGTALQTRGDEVYVLTYGPSTPQQLRKDGAEILWVLDKELETQWRTCPAEPGYLESDARNGRIGSTQYGAFDVVDSLVFCVQSISPSVAIVNRYNGKTERTTVAPPFYREPVDTLLTLNQKAMFAWLGSWTAQINIFALARGAGFVSAYSRFDEAQGTFRYWLFHCSLDATLHPGRCSVAATMRKPLLVTPDGTVFLEEEVDPDGPPVIGVYRIAGEGR